MKHRTIPSEPWWQVPLLLLVCLFAGSSPTWADAREFKNATETNTVVNTPTVAKPYLAFNVLYYDDTKGSNGFFIHQSPSGVPSGVTDGPALFIDDKYICSPDNELAWPGGKNTGNSSGANDATGASGWWKNTYTKTVDDVTYTVMFYNPYKESNAGQSGSKRLAVTCLVFMDKVQLGKTYKVKVAGYWKINNNHDPQEQSYTWTFNNTTMGLQQNPSAEIVEYGKIKVSGGLLTDYGPTIVGTYNGATKDGLKWADTKDLDNTYRSYNQGTASFSDQAVSFTERSNYAGQSAKYVEYIIPRNNYTPEGYNTLKTKLNMNVYQWFKTTVPGYIAPNGLTFNNPSQWTKQVTLNWTYAGSYTGGTWNVYRYKKNGSRGEPVKTGLSYSTKSYTIAVPELNKEYTYEVAFIPTNGEYRGELSLQKDFTLTRSWGFNSFKAAVNSDGDSIKLSWAHNAIEDAGGNKTYNLILQRSENYNINNPDAATWSNIKTFPINSKQTNEGNYKDDKSSGLQANHTYSYRLKISLLDTDITSTVATVKLGGSKITAFTATRGTYSNMVKLEWNVKQVGTNVTNFILQRRPLGSNDEQAWANIYKTSGTASAYSYDDVTALPGSYNEYKVIVWSGNGDTMSVDDAQTTDGFSLTTGSISGNITFGTGTAVEGARVVLKQLNADGNITSGMRSVKLSGKGAGMKYATDNKTLKRLLTNNFTVQMYVNPDSSTMNVNDREYRIFDVEWALTINAKYDAAHKRYKLKGYFGGEDFESKSLYIPAGEWSHISLAYDSAATTLTFYLTQAGETQKEVVSRKAASWDKSGNADCFAIGNVGSFSAGDNWFEGYIDEFRFFTKTLTERDILHNYNHPLSGNETGLAIYYPLDEGLTSQNIAYDFSKTNGSSNGRHAVMMVPGEGSTYIPSEDQLSLMAYTDVTGFYEVRGIPFSGEGTSYSVIPTLDIHEFLPTTRSRFVSMSSLNHSGVDFEDISSFPVSGKIFYAGTDYPVEGVSLLVDGVACAKDGQPIVTNKDGEFEISVPIGDHFISVDKTKHVFTDGGRYPADPGGVGVRHTFNKPIKNLDFYDETLVNFSGRVVGGDTEGEKTIGFGLSTNNIGVAELVLIPVNPNPRMNVKKVETETSYSYETNEDTVAIASASAKVKSTSWRGAGSDNCQKLFIRTDPKSGEFSAMLPPVTYQFFSMTIPSNDDVLFENLPQVDLSNPTIEYTDTLYGENGSAEVFTYNTQLRQTFHSEPTFNVTQVGHDDGAFGISSYKLLDEMGGIDIQDIYTINNGKPVYKYGGAIFEMSEPYTFNLEAYEQYTNKDVAPAKVFTVPLKDLVVTIENALSDKQPIYVENGTVGDSTVTAGQVANLQDNQLQLDSLGKATYTWKGGLPNITPPYSRTITMSYDINGRPYVWSGLKGVILGSLPTGNNFVTSGPDMIDMILRDPPGTGSSAEWSSGTVVSRSTANMGTWNSENHLTTTSKLGVDATTVTGVLPGVATVNDIHSTSDVEVGVMINIEGEAGDTWSRTVTATKTITTSDAMEYVGAQGDVFVGTATNIIFGKARNVGFQRVGTSEKAEIKLDDIITTGVSFGTEFVYTQNYIENVLIPNLEALRNNLLTTVDDVEGHTCDGDHPKYLTTRSPGDEGYGESNPPTVYECHTAWADFRYEYPSSDGPSYKMIVPNENENYQDSVLWCNNQIAAWQKYLYINEEQKVRAYELRTTTDSVEYKNFSFDSGASITNSVEIEESKGYKYDVQVAVGVHLNRTWGVEIKKTGVIFDVGTETTAGYHREDENSTTEKTAFSYTLKEEGDDDALTVDVYKYGNYGPIFRTRGGQTCAPYEGEVVTKYYKPGTVIQEATMQIEVPQIDVDVPIVSDVPTGGTANYTLRLSNASEIDEDVYYRLLVDDESNPDGAALSIDGKVLTDSRIIKIPAGTTVTKQLQLKQTNTSILDYDSVAVILASQSQFDPTSTWDVIADTVLISAHFVPSSSEVQLALSKTLMNTQTDTIVNLTFSGFDRNYRGLKAFRLQYKKQGSTNWTQLHEYVLDSLAVTQNNELLPKNGAKVSYTQSMASFADGDYLFRVVSVSTYGTGEVYRYSDEIALTKDMSRPRPLGQPEPTDGVLDIGDELSVSFNEAFLKGELTKEKNFRVTGVLNGAEVAHETALSMQNTESTAQTEASIMLARKDFSFDAWVNLNGAGTILSHGVGTNKFTVGTNADGKLVVSIADSTYTSKESVPFGKWAFLTLNYKATDNGGDLSATVACETTSYLFSSKGTIAYEGNGPLTVGKQMNGAIHELLLWDEAHDMTTALLNRSVTKNPSTRHLIGYWKMDEGEGTTIRDYARNRHMTMNNETWYLNNENKAVSFDGNSFVKLLVDDSPYTTNDDYAVEFWMQGGQQTAEAQLLQAGEVALWLNTEGQLQLTTQSAYNPAGETSVAINSGVLTDNAWHHVALNVLRQGAAAVYVDGKRCLSTNATNVGHIATDNIIVGARRVTFSAENAEYDYDRAFKGLIDEVRIWDATLNGDKLTADRKIRLTGNEDGLVAYYPFEKKQLDSGNQVETVGNATDLTGSGHTAQLLALNGSPAEMNYSDNAPALRTKPTETNVSFTFTASDTKVVIDIDEDPAIIEGCTLNFTVRDMRDENGNLSLPVLWSAFVNQKELIWKEEDLAVTQQVKSQSSVTATVVNKSGKQQMWTLSGMPSWLQASTEYGTTNPLEETDITFTVSPATPIGKYEETIYLKSNNGIETPLTISVKVTGKVPDWSVNPNDYLYSMNVIGRVEIEGKAMDNEDDILAAFIGEECRGIAHPVYKERYDGSFITMDIYGNSDDNESDEDKEVTFRAYDASTGTLYPVVLPGKDVKFTPLSLIGKYDDPVVFSVEDLIEQSTDLKAGWNWLSLYVTTDNMTVPGIFEKIADDVVTVKSQTKWSALNASGEWKGGLEKENLTNDQMYAVQLKADRKLRLVGQPVTNCQVNVVPGWNWVGYYGRQVISIGNALAGMQPENSDILKGQSGVTYYDSYEWAGSLPMMEPGVGYMVWSSAKEDRPFSYPSAAIAAARSLAPSAINEPLSTLFTPVNFRLYAGNAIMAVRLTAADKPVANAALGVFAGEECRTAARTDDEGMAYLTIPGDDQVTLTFKVALGNEVFDVPATVSYEVDGVYGSPDSPLVIDLSDATGIVDVDAHVDVHDVYDLQGRKVDLKDNGRKLPKGVYIIDGQKKTVK